MCMNGIEKSKEEILSDVMNRVGLPPHKVRNIYVYGSRVYGTHTINSDYDVIVVACSLYINHEIFDGAYNIHITTPDSFADQLRQHDVHCLECIFAPEEARIQTQIDYKKSFTINPGQLKKMMLSQSAWAWSKAQRRIENGNIIGGAKSLFHSLRILKFGIQLLKHGEIIDFSEANKMWNAINECHDLEWESYKNRWISTKKSLAKILRTESPVFNNIDISVKSR